MEVSFLLELHQQMVQEAQEQELLQQVINHMEQQVLVIHHQFHHLKVIQEVIMQVMVLVQLEVGAVLVHQVVMLQVIQ